MRIDNDIRDMNTPPDTKEVAFRRKFEAILVRELDMPYADVVHAYRQLEDEFIKAHDSNDWQVLETKRRIAEGIFRGAHDAEQPFEVCRDAWNALVELGFSSVGTYSTMAWFYADCCLSNAQYDVGIEVIDSVIAEIHHRLIESGLTTHAVMHYDRELDDLESLREGLVAYKSSEAEGDAWDERREAERDARHARETSPSERRRSQLICQLFGVSRPIGGTSSDRSHLEMVRDYQKAEADFLGCLESGDEIFVPEVHGHFATAILENAHARHEPFEVCRAAWNELVRWGFRDLEHRCGVTRVYGECCLVNEQPEAGLAVVQPLLVDLQKHSTEGTDTEMPRLRYRREIARLTKLRDDLQAIANRRRLRPGLMTRD